MPASARSAGRSQHGRLKRRAQALGEEIDRLGIRQEGSLAPDLRVVGTTQDNSGFNIENFLDRALDLTKGWEKIAALVALITTNLSGNKSLGALLEIMAKDKVIKGAGITGDGQSSAPGSLNIGDLLSMAENILKTGQLPPSLMAMQPAGMGTPADSADVIEASPANPGPEDEPQVTEDTVETVHSMDETLEQGMEPVIVREDSGAFSDGLDA